MTRGRGWIERLPYVVMECSFDGGPSGSVGKSGSGKIVVMNSSNRSSLLTACSACSSEQECRSAQEVPAVRSSKRGRWRWKEVERKGGGVNALTEWNLPCLLSSPMSDDSRSSHLGRETGDKQGLQCTAGRKEQAAISFGPSAEKRRAVVGEAISPYVEGLGAQEGGHSRGREGAEAGSRGRGLAQVGNRRHEQGAEVDSRAHRGVGTRGLEAGSWTS